MKDNPICQTFNIFFSGKYFSIVLLPFTFPGQVFVYEHLFKVYFKASYSLSIQYAVGTFIEKYMRANFTRD